MLKSKANIQVFLPMWNNPPLASDLESFIVVEFLIFLMGHHVENFQNNLSIEKAQFRILEAAFNKTKITTCY